MPPTNDDFASAIDLTGTSGDYTFSNVGATTETGEPANAEGHSVWFKVTPAADASITIFTSNTPLPAWDSFLAIYTGPDVASLDWQADDDDSDPQSGSTDPYGTSRVTFDATGGTTYYVQVTAWNDVSGPVERSDAVISWVLAPPLPTINYFTPTQGVIGTTITIVGTHLTGATQVTIGGVSTAFTVVSDTSITATVPNGAVGRSIVVAVSTPNGIASRSGFTPMYPGPWVQPPDRPTTQPWILMAQVQTTISGDAPTAPYANSGSNSVTTLGNPQTITEGRVSEFFGVVSHNWSFTVVPVVLDMDNIFNNVTEPFFDVQELLMPLVTPTTSETSDPDYIFASVQYEGVPHSSGNPVGSYVGPITLKVGTKPVNPLSHVPPTVRGTGGFWLDDVDGKTINHTSDMWASRVQLRSLADSDWSIDYTVPDTPRIDMSANPFTMLTGTPIIDEALLDSDSELTVTSLGTRNGSAMSNNAEYVTHGRDPLSYHEVTLDLSDLDGDRRIGFIVCLDSHSASVNWTPTHQNSTDTLSYGSEIPAKLMSTGLTADTGATWIYRPPRYRLYYCRPVLVTVVPPLRLANRDDQYSKTGSAPRIKANNHSTSGQVNPAGRIPQNNVYW